MSQFIANRSMENFFIHPTMTQDTSMETFARISIMSEPSPKVRFDDFPLSEEGKEEKSRPVSTIQDLFLNSNFLASYHSEEESASPRGSSDSLSLDADDEAEILSETPSPEEKVSQPSAIDLFLVPEALANSCTKIEHRCNRAQAVVLKPVGKPKVVSMPRTVDVRPGQYKRMSNDSLASAMRSPHRAESRKSLRSTTSTRVSFDRNEPLPALPISVLPTPTEEPQEEAATPVTPRETPKRQPSVPLMRAANAFDPFPRLSDIAAGNVTRQDMAVKRSATVSTPEWSAADGSPMSPAKRRLHRIASTISNASDLVRRKSSISSLRKSVSSATPTSRASLIFDKDSPHTPMGPIPKRRSSMGKLTPRGPTERAPIIVLPPCPDDEEEDDDFGDAGSAQAMSKWDRPRARQAAMYGKQRPSIDGMMAAGA